MAAAFPGPSPPPQSKNNSAASAPRSSAAPQQQRHGRGRGTAVPERGQRSCGVARPGAGHAADGVRDGRTDGQVVIPSTQPSICQTDPVPKLLPQPRRCPGTGLLPAEPPLTPGLSGAQPLPAGAVGVRARCGRAGRVFPRGPCPVKLCLLGEAKQTPGTAESAARAAPGAGPASPPSRRERGRWTNPPRPGHREQPRLEERFLPRPEQWPWDAWPRSCGTNRGWGGIPRSCLQHIPCQGVTSGVKSIPSLPSQE